MSTREKLILAWLKKAEKDYKACKRLSEVDFDLIELAAYHAQQAIEKWLKALLVAHGQIVPKTHDLVALVSLVRQSGPYFSQQEWIEGAALVSGYAVEIRYPIPDEEEISRETFDTIEGFLERFKSEVETYLGYPLSPLQT